MGHEGRERMKYVSKHFIYNLGWWRLRRNQEFWKRVEQTNKKVREMGHLQAKRVQILENEQKTSQYF